MITDKKIKTIGSGSHVISLLFQMANAIINAAPARMLIGRDLVHIISGFFTIMLSFLFRKLNISSNDLIACHPPKYSANAGSSGRNIVMIKIANRFINRVIGNLS